MGVKNFTKVFISNEITIKNLKKQTLAIDASLEIYRSALGMKTIDGLTDKSGKSTLHISVILANIIKYTQHQINTIWIFDFDPCKLENKECNNPLKMEELKERKLKRDNANAKIKQIQESQSQPNQDPDFSDVTDDESEPMKQIGEKNDIELQRQKKIAFSMPQYMVNDIKLILNLLGIKWAEAPRGVEAECLAAKLTHPSVGLADAVLSSDADSLLFGAKSLIKKNTKTNKYNQFYLNDILNNNNLNMDEFIKIGIVLGTDMYKDKEKLFYRIGPKTVIKKIKSGILDEKFQNQDVKKAIDHFTESCCIENIEWHGDSTPFQDKNNILKLIEWLVVEKNFNRDRIEKRIKKLL